MATTLDSRSPLPASVPTFQCSPVVKHSPICSELRQGFQHESAKVTDYGSQTEKKTLLTENQGRKRKLPAAKKLPSKKETTDTGKKKSKKAEDIDLPKRPPTAFIRFLASFKEEFKKENPDVKSAVMVSKSAGAKWKSMSEEEKQPYFKLAADGKAAYENDLESYRSKQSSESKAQQAVGDEVLSSTALHETDQIIRVNAVCLYECHFGQTNGCVNT